MAVRHGTVDFNKIEFLHEISSIRERTFTKRTITSGWAKGGYFPWDPELVLSKLEQPRPSTPLLPSSPPIPSSPVTPHDARSTLRLAYHISTKLYTETPIEPRHIKRLVKTSVRNAYSLAQTTRDLYATTKVTKARQIRQKKDQRWIQQGGVMYSKDARKAVIAKDNGEANKVVGKVGEKAALEASGPVFGTIIQWELPKNS
ncbi:hypothetical protein P154DRAFT_596129 [Amniculicola lignicola CBS 123094]|uniref:Uncharacterized protein n=1 Tax=Amniculicola lignicola CBS 123094 TaxID=1392246 RepID=A0A6A5WVC7_9PLEO|nr:hypothetical protein P154DRAFT_596129 [Amniculicola lignicola CBS 123094]